MVLNIASLNVQGIHQNKLFATEAVNKYEILCLQEHWLNEYDKADLATMFPDKIIRCKCTSEEIDNSRRSSGTGGVATILDKKLEPFILPESTDGNDRIQVNTLKIGDHRICIVNCYLPSGTSRIAVDKYEEDLDALHIILQKYATHDMLIIGDMNADHYNRNGAKERKMTDLISEHNLTDLGTYTKHAPTYINPHLKHQSRIDHAFIKSDQREISWNQLKIYNDENFNLHNTSYHVLIALTASLTTEIQEQQGGNAIPTKRIAYPRKDLRKVDFTNKVTQEIQKIKWHSLDTNEATSTLIKVIDTAMTSSTKPKVIYTGKRNNPKTWFPELEKAVKDSKEIHFRWKEAGKPRDDDPLWTDKKNAKKEIRKVQRRKIAMDRKSLLEEISRATENDPNLAHKLIKKQRKEDGKSSCLIIRDEVTTDSNIITAEWATYFENLSKAETYPEEDLELAFMRKTSAKQPSKIFTRDTLEKAIRSLKSNKAADDNGHYAELLRLIPENCKNILLALLNRILTDGIIPDSMKEAYKIVLPKPGKDHKLMDNYRGITIAGLLMKLLEILWAMTGNEDKINSHINDLQFGFTRKRSPSMASLIITEAIAEAKATRSPLYLISIDARKAFDVVDHFILRKKLFHSGLDSQMWTLADNMYVKPMEKIRWDNMESRSYELQRGVKQGSIISPLLYKLYINGLLEGLQHTNLGLNIGTTYIGAPTCADDVVLITNETRQIQPLLDATYNYATGHRYQLHPQKSTVTQIVKNNSRNAAELHNKHWYIGDHEILKCDEVTHLGITWNSGKTAPDINQNVKKARRTSFALLRVGLHGLNGIDPPAAFKIIQTYVTPKLLHGLEACVLNSKDLQLLDKYYKKLLRQIQALPDNTASEAIYLLIGALPIEAQLHRRALSLFGNIARLPLDHQLRRLARRQLATQYDNPYSWFHYICKLGEKYSLDIISEFNSPEDKPIWKKKYTTAITSKIQSELWYDTATKSTLKWGIWTWSPPDGTTPHPLWLCCQGKATRIEMATTRIRMMVGRYRTQEVQAKYLKKITLLSDACPLCNEETEDILHMLVTCASLKETREEKIATLKEIYVEEGVPPPANPHELCSAILNGWGYRRTNSLRSVKKVPLHNSVLAFNSSFSDLSGFSSNSSFSSNLDFNPAFNFDFNSDIYALKSDYAINRANNITNSLCHMLSTNRDILLHGGSPNRGGK